VARYTEGSESYALHNSLRVPWTPGVERGGVYIPVKCPV
jgi:hypothetical protein